MNAAAVLLQEQRAEVLWLTLNRPAQANAMNLALQQALIAALAAAASDASVQAVVLAAAGERVFSAGADLKEIKEMAERAAAPNLQAGTQASLESGATRLLRLLCAVLDFPKPLVCAVQGKAVGAGCMLALLADQVLAADSASFSLPELALGMPSPMGAAALALRTPLALARAMLQECASVTAPAALQVGMIDAVVQADALAQHAQQRTSALARRSGPGYAGNKQWLQRAVRAQLVDAAQVADQLRQGRSGWSGRSIALGTATGAASIQPSITTSIPLKK